MKLVASGSAGVLLSLILVFAGVSRAAPLDIGTAKQVFVDGRFVETSAGATLAVNRPYPTGEKLIVQNKPWEDFWVGGYMSVIQEAYRIRLWYECADQRKGDHVAYAESIDGGATWAKPDLGITEYQGARNNNIVVTGIHGATVFRNRPDAPDGERYCMFVGSPNKAFVSPDGFHWVQKGPAPFLNMAGHSGLDSQNVMFWDTRIEKYVAYPRLNDPTLMRTVARSESAVFGDFPDPAIVFSRDDQDPPGLDFYTSAAIQYPFAADAYYMFPAAYHHTPPPPPNDGPLDIQFAASRDGVHWVRPDRRPIIRKGIDGAWNGGCTYVGRGLSRQGNTLSLYYKANDITHGAYTLMERGPGGSISRALYRLDGFMSMDAGYHGGEFTTPALVFGGSRIEVNFDGSAGGWLRIEIRDAQGNPLPGFTEEDADKVTGNAVAKAAAWAGNSDVSSLRGTPVKLRFVMRDAKLYAFHSPG